MLVSQQEQIFSFSEEEIKLVEELPIEEEKVPMILPENTMPVIIPSHFETVILSSNEQTEEPSSAEKSSECEDDTKWWLKGIDPADAKLLEDEGEPEFYM